MNIEKLNSLAKTDFTNFIQSENNVKYKIVIPFLQSFNQVDLDLEHAAQGSRIDINIGNKIIVETKALGQNIDLHVQQLSDYSGKELPVLAILTNGRHFRIYSPQWRYWRTFREKLIYEFELKDLSDIQLLNRLEKILDFSNYESEEFYRHIEEREQEILKIKNEIKAIQNSCNENLSSIETQIKELDQEINILQGNAKLKQKEIEELKNSMNIEIKNLEDKCFYPIKTNNKKVEVSIHPKPVSSGNTPAWLNDNIPAGLVYETWLPYWGKHNEYMRAIANKMADRIEKLEPQSRRAYEKYLNAAVIGHINPDIVQIENKEISSASYLPSYIQQIFKQGTMPNKMLKYIRERSCVTWDEIIKEMTEKHGYKESSGSLGASFKALETKGLIRVEGSKSKGKIYFVKDNNER